MDNSSWFHGYATDNTAVGGNNGFMCGYAASCTPSELQQKQEDEEELLLISSPQIQHHLNQISMRMNMEDEVVYDYDDGALEDLQQHRPMVDVLLDPHYASSFPSSSSSSSLSLRSACLSSSPESSAQHIHGAPAPTAAGQYPEVSSHVPPLPPLAAPYTNVVQVPTPAAAHHHDASAATKPSAFKRFARHLGPRRPPKPGACGQKMFKTALSVLSKMHMAATSARYNQQQQYYYQQQQQQQASAEAAPSVNQLQHMISERKRREKLNDSFHALRAVLPPGAKKDKTSILVRAREYIRSLESKASELEEKNKSLESRLSQRGSSRDAGKHAGGGDDDESREKQVQIEITRAAAKEGHNITSCDLCTVKIAVRSGCNMTDVALRTLQCLKDQVGDGVNLVSMNTSGGSTTGGPPQTGRSSSSSRAVLTMQIKSPPSAKWEEQPVKDAVAKVVADALTLSDH